MATGKRYYWFKLYESFMKGPAVDYLMSLDNGAMYVMLYLMLCIITINTKGRLESRVGKIRVPYSISKITRECKWFSENMVRSAMDIFVDAELVVKNRNGVYQIVDYKNLVGSESDYAAQKRDQRNKKDPDQDDEDNNMDNDMDNDMDNIHTDEEFRDNILDRDPIDTEYVDDDIRAHEEEIESSYRHDLGRAPNPEEVSQILAFITAVGFGPGVAEHAIHQAAKYGAHNPAPYIKSVLSNWELHNLLTLDAVVQAEMSGEFKPNKRNQENYDLPE